MNNAHRRDKDCTFRVTADEREAVRRAAKKAGVTVSQLCGKIVLDVVQDAHVRADLPTQKCFEEVRRLRRLFCRVMYLSLSGSLTKHDIERLEKGSAE